MANQSEAYVNLANQRSFFKTKYYCITVHYRTVRVSENHLGQTGQKTLRHLELFSDYVLQTHALALKNVCKKENGGGGGGGCFLSSFYHC